MLATGATTGQIARELAVSPNTVRTHTQSILIKLQVHSRLEAVTYAIRHSIIRLPGTDGARGRGSGPGSTADGRLSSHP